MGYPEQGALYKYKPKFMEREEAQARARGGRVEKPTWQTGGAASGPGRLEKNEHWARHGDKRKQDV